MQRLAQLFSMAQIFFFPLSLSLSLSFWKVLLLLLPVVRLFCPFFGLRRGGEGMGVTPSFLAKKIIM